MRKWPASGDVFPAVTNWFRRNKLSLAELSDRRKNVSVRGLMRKVPEEKLLLNKSDPVRTCKQFVAAAVNP